MNKENKKIKLAIALASTCSGCDVAILDLHEKILDLAAVADIVYWPTAMDFKISDLNKLGDSEIDITLLHGTIRTSEHEHVAHVFRKKSKVLIAFGACACFGGIPSLCNITNKDEIFKIVYQSTPSTINPEGTLPKTRVVQDGHLLTLPELLEEGKALPQIVDVDYYVPGCPPMPHLIEKLVPVISDFIQTGKLPPKGAVIASDKTLCDECPLTKENKRISKIYRVQDFIPDPKRCLLEQGLICLGPATRGGCGAKCINVLMPCRGCMGPTAEVRDQGVKMINALASVLGVEDEKNHTQEDIERLTDEIADPLGTFYRFTLAVALLNKKVKEEKAV